MNSQFKNSSLGFYIYTTIIVIIAVASIFVFWYMVKGYKLGTYAEDTIIGSVYVGGMQEDATEAKILNRINRWLNDKSIIYEVTYQGYSYELDRELFYFDYDTSIFYVVEGETNELVVSFQGDYQQDISNEIKNSDFLENIDINNIDMDRLLGDVLMDASLMKSYSSKKLENYFTDYSIANEDLDSIELVIPEGISVDEMVATVSADFIDSKIMIYSKELFDITERLSDSFSDTEMTVLSSAMLRLILETNFSINEVHYIPIIDYVNYTIDTFPTLGHNASVNQVIGDGFSFYNPNDSDYYFTLEKTGDTTVKLSLIGLVFIDDISAFPISTQRIEYITQTTSNDEYLQAGHDGVVVEVTRTVRDIYGKISSEKVIIFEFYPSTKEIILGP